MLAMPADASTRHDIQHGWHASNVASIRHDIQHGWDVPDVASVLRYLTYSLGFYITGYSIRVGSCATSTGPFEIKPQF